MKAVLVTTVFHAFHFLVSGSSTAGQEERLDYWAEVRQGVVEVANP